jgi:hypothetical protein
LIKIETITWRITKIGMTVTIPTFIFIYVKSKYIPSLFYHRTNINLKTNS